MSLFTDGVIVTIDDLRGYESSMLEVAHTEGIDLATKLALAQEEVAVELEALLRRTRAERPDLGKVVVTRPLRQWLVFHTLAVAYRDAYNSQLNDRYLGKWKEYAQLAQWAARMLRETGVGVVSAPIRKAREPEMSATPGNGIATRHYVQVAWCNAAGAEGAPSEVSVYDTPDGALLAVEANDAPAVACGWSIYAGTSPETITLQSETVLELGEKWTASESGPVNGRKPGQGQEPEAYLLADRTLQRG